MTTTTTNSPTTTTRKDAAGVRRRITVTKHAWIHRPPGFYGEPAEYSATIQVADMYVQVYSPTAAGATAAAIIAFNEQYIY